MPSFLTYTAKLVWRLMAVLDDSGMEAQTHKFRLLLLLFCRSLTPPV